MDTTTPLDAPTTATDTPPTWSELCARRLAGRIEATDDGLDRVDAAEETDETGTRTAERDGRSRSEPPGLDHRWMLVAPLAGAVVLSAVSTLVEPNPLRTATSSAGLVAFAVLTSFFLVCVAGTLALIRDAERLRAFGTGWSPNPWHYVVPSAVALAGLHATRVVRRTGAIEGVVGFAVGTLVVALAMSSILAGPAYLLQRRRRLGSD